MKCFKSVNRSFNFNPLIEKEISVYHVIKSQRSLRREFTIIFLLDWGCGRSHETASDVDVINAIQQWMQKRFKDGKNFSDVIVTTGKWVIGSHTAVEDKIVSGHIPSVIISGNVTSVIQGRRLRDYNVVEMINDLSAFLGEKFHQQYIHVSFRDKSWVLSNDT